MRLLPTVALALTLAAPAAAQLAHPNQNGITYGHVHLNVTDVALHTQLWIEHFGGVVVRTQPVTMIRLPNNLIVLTEQTPTGGSQGSVMDHYGVKVQNTERFLNKWRAAGLPTREEFTGAEGFPNAYVMMPDDVRVELQEDPQLPVEVAGYHVHFITPEFDELLTWYEETFELKRRPRGRIETTTDVPGMNMSFGSSEETTVPSVGRAIDHIGFEIDDLEAFCERLTAKGVELDIEYHEIEGVGIKSAFLTDPSGTRVHLTEGLDGF